MSGKRCANDTCAYNRANASVPCSHADGCTDYKEAPARAPLLTVAICAYNAQDTIAETLRSLALQTCMDFELVVVEDGENAEQHSIICEALAEIPVKAIGHVHHDNFGIGHARNTALSLVRTPYVSFLDADDLLMPHAVETLTEACKADCDVVVGKTMREAPDGRFEIVGIESATWLHGRAYKLDLLREYEIVFPNIRMSEDLGFNACVEEFADRDKIAQTYTPIHIQRWRMGSLSRRDVVSGELSSETYMYALEHYLHTIRANDVEYVSAKVLPGFLAGAFYRIYNTKDAERRHYLIGLMRETCADVMRSGIMSDPDFRWRLGKEMAKGFLAYATDPDSMVNLFKWVVV